MFIEALLCRPLDKGPQIHTIKIHRWRQTVYCPNTRFGSTNLLLFFILARSCIIYRSYQYPWHCMANLSWLTLVTIKNEIFNIKSWNICTYFVYFKSNKELNYDRLVDSNILSASRLVHLYLRINRISFFLLDLIHWLPSHVCHSGCIFRL